MPDFDQIVVATVLRYYPTAQAVMDASCGNN
jgi:hypothetical protein